MGKRNHTWRVGDRVIGVEVKANDPILALIEVVGSAHRAATRAQSLAHRRVELVPYTDVQREFLAYLPVVLEIERVPPLPEMT